MMLLPSWFGLKTAAVVGAVLSILSFSGGVWVRGSFCDVAKYRAEVATLKDQLAATMVAYEQDAQTARENASKVEDLEKAIRDAQDAVAAKDGDCLSADDARRLRNLWPTETDTRANSR